MPQPHLGAAPAHGLLEHLKRGRSVLTPDIVLTPGGPQQGHAIVVEEGRLAYVGPAGALEPSDAARARALPGHAIVPGFVDAHTHLAQTFGKILIGGEPAQMRHWWHTPNRHLDGAPIELVRSVQGLLRVVEYLDAMRGKL